MLRIPGILCQHLLWLKNACQFFIFNNLFCILVVLVLIVQLYYGFWMIKCCWQTSLTFFIVNLEFQPSLSSFWCEYVETQWIQTRWLPSQKVRPAMRHWKIGSSILKIWLQDLSTQHVLWRCSGTAGVDGNIHWTVRAVMLKHTACVAFNVLS